MIPFSAYALLVSRRCLQLRLKPCWTSINADGVPLGRYHWML